MTKRPITVYDFDSAPEYLKRLSKNGGDEDWIIVVPPEHIAGNEPPYWVLSQQIGCCSVDEYPHPGMNKRYSKTDYSGFKVYIGCHA